MLALILEFIGSFSVRVKLYGSFTQYAFEDPSS
jgi:hypothetical protein